MSDIVSANNKLWAKAKSLIPGGGMLLSKRPEMLLPEHWPTYFSAASGCRVTDLDGAEFIDMSLMGVGTNSLGYAHPDINKAVIDAVNAGSMSTLNCHEEVALAERLVAMHPWADMARFARTGGEANAIAIRIARAASGRDKVAFCGYHGWHDWYLSANIGDASNLDSQLLPGLSTTGVPRNLAGSVLPFQYNDLEGLTRLVTDHDVGVIKMEVYRNMPPADGFLQAVRNLADERGIVLIFDECTSGFRETFGGLHLKYGVEPDLATFGKALGNGFAITAVLGRKDVMEAAQATFISSTFWTERLGPAAALATLEVMERTNSWDQISETGRRIKSIWSAAAEAHGVTVKVQGLDALASVQIGEEGFLVYKTLFTQEMLKRGYLGTTLCYICTEHTPEVVSAYAEAVDEVFGIIGKCASSVDAEAMLDGPVCSAGFSRLN